jgi:hypothetical protein
MSSLSFRTFFIHVRQWINHLPLIMNTALDALLDLTLHLPGYDSMVRLSNWLYCSVAELTRRMILVLVLFELPSECWYISVLGHFDGAISSSRFPFPRLLNSSIQLLAISIFSSSLTQILFILVWEAIRHYSASGDFSIFLFRQARFNRFRQVDSRRSVWLRVRQHEDEICMKTTVTALESDWNSFSIDTNGEIQLVNEWLFCSWNHLMNNQELPWLQLESIRKHHEQITRVLRQRYWNCCDSIRFVSLDQSLPMAIP